MRRPDLAANGEGGPLLELPTSRLSLYSESVFMYYSIFHWLPLINGYTGYPPRSYLQIMASVNRLPEPAALEEILAKARPRWIVLHRNLLAPAASAKYEALLRPRTRTVGEFGAAELFEVAE